MSQSWQHVTSLTKVSYFCLLLTLPLEAHVREACPVSTASATSECQGLSEE